ncbi:MAG TPA: hypothetical protein PLA24_11465 [Tenuifilaceae bacterium]|nr:hypothetical protein [Tenuifilaceae bacterium]
MRYKFLLVVAFACASTVTFAQRDIEPRLIISDTSNYNFTGEWQYLSTDIFLFNANKFSELINELDFGKPERKLFHRKRNALEDEQLEYLFITASLKNVKFFGDKDITYPLYNFQISRDKDNKYQTFVSDNIDHVRIIDNLPLYTAKDYIDAEINVRAITNNDRDMVLGMVATQLKNLSKILTPTEAVMGIIGEFGNFLESSTRKKEYKFSSTIRLFEQKNFDTRVHSIKLYALTTANSKPIEINTAPVRAFLDTVKQGKVSRAELSGLIGFKDYPVIVVVNYKSLYQMEPVSGDEVTFANIEKRKLNVENDYRSGLINAETYRQEKDFISFLTVFANFKNHLDVYNLNFRTGNTDAVSSTLFLVMQYYRQLVKTYNEIKFKYKSNTTYSSVFEGEYESILGFAALYLDNDFNLKATKELVNTLLSLEKSPEVPTEKLEQTISTLRFSDYFKPEFMQQNLEGQLIKSHIQRLENQLLKATFQPEIEKVSNEKATPQNAKAEDKLMSMAKNTACVLCRTKAMDAIGTFNKRIDEYRRNIEEKRHDSIVNAIQPWIFQSLESIHKVKSSFCTVFPDSSAESAVYIMNKISEAERDVNNTGDFTKVDIKGKDLSVIQALNEKLLDYKSKVDETLKLICSLKPALCNLQNTESNTASELFTISDSTVKQNNIFIAIFDNQLNSLEVQCKSDSASTNEKELETVQKMQQRLKTAVSVLQNGKIPKSDYQKIENEINELVSEISNRLSLLSGLR